MYELETARQQADLQVQAAKAQSKMADAAVATAKAQLAQLTIRTPIAGVLNELTCQLGQTLAVGTSVGEVVDAHQLQAVVWLAVADAQRLKPRQAAAVRACGSSRIKAARGRTVAAVVLDVGKMADPQTGNLPVPREDRQCRGPACPGPGRDCVDCAPRRKGAGRAQGGRPLLGGRGRCAGREGGSRGNPRRQDGHAASEARHHGRRLGGRR